MSEDQATTTEAPAAGDNDERPESPIMYVREDPQAAAMADELRAAVDATPIGELGHDDAERQLLRYLRRRSQLAAELQHVADQTAALLKDLEGQIKSLDYLYTDAAAATTKSLLKGKKAKSVKTPFGTVGFRTHGGGIVVNDPDKLLAAADTQIDLIAIVRQPPQPPREVNKTALNEYFKRTGDVPPGCGATDATETFYVR